MNNFPPAMTIRFDRDLPVGAFTREGDTFTFHCVGCAEGAFPGFYERFQLIRSVPPALFDTVTERLVDIFTEDEWQQAKATHERYLERRRDALRASGQEV